MTKECKCGLSQLEAEAEANRVLNIRYKNIERLALAMVKSTSAWHDCTEKASSVIWEMEKHGPLEKA